MSDVEGHSNSSLSSGTTEVGISNQPRCRRVKRRLFSENSRANVSSPLDINQPPAGAVDSNVDPFPPVAGNRRNLHPDISTFTSVNAGKSNLDRLEETLDDNTSITENNEIGENQRTPSPPPLHNNNDSESTHSSTPSPPPLQGNRHHARANSTPSPPPLRQKEETRSQMPMRRARRTSVAKSRDGNDNFISAASGRWPESDRENPRVYESSDRSSIAQQQHINLPTTRLTLMQMQASLQMADSASLANYIRDLNEQDGVPNLSLAPLATASTSRNDEELNDSCSNTKQRDHKSPAKVRDWSSDDDFPTPRQQSHEHKPSAVALPGNNEMREDDDKANRSPSPEPISNDDESEAEGSIHSATPSPPPLQNNRHNARAKSTPSPPPPRRTRRTSVAESRDGNENFISAASESDRDNQVRERIPVVQRRRRRRSRSGTISPDPGLGENVPAPDQRLVSRKRNSIVCAALAAGVQPTPFRLPKNQTPIVPRRPNQSAVPRRALTDADRPFHCRRCGKSFTRKENYRRHKIEKHARVPKVYICDYCGALFSSKRNQEVHIRSRHLEQRQFYYCPHCNLLFINRGAKYAHQKICSEKPQSEENENNGAINESEEGNESTSTLED